jgi:N-acetylneuraminic acid mutarotase
MQLQGMTLGLKRTEIISVISLIILLIALLVVDVKPVFSTSNFENTWITKTPMPQATGGGFKSAVVEGKIYVMSNSINYMYDPTMDTWTSRTPMPIQGSGFSLAVYHNQIYAIGGSFTEVYDVSHDSWQTKTPMPTNIFASGANVVNGEIYLISGYTVEYQTIGLNQVYNIANDSWTTKASLPYPVFGYASAVSGGKIYIIGGQDQNLHNEPINVNFTQIYDPMADTWSLGAPMPTTVLDAAAGATTGVMAPNRIYVFGGVPDGQMSGSNLTQVYDPGTNSWMYGTQKPVAREALTVAVVNDTLYALGGQEIVSAPSSPFVNEQYTPFDYGTLPSPVASLSAVPSYSAASDVTHLGKSFPPLTIAGASIVLILVGVSVLILLLKRKRKVVSN